MADVRYRRDRVFPLQGGYYTDSSLGESPQWIDVRFGSDRYFELAEREAQLGAAELLAVAPNVKFELLGRAFRVTDGLDPGMPESDFIPPPVFGGEQGTTTVDPATSTFGEPGSASPAGSETAGGVGSTHDPARSSDLSRGGFACTTVASRNRAGFPAGCVALLVVASAGRRFRRRPAGLGPSWRRSRAQG
jgi:hypothetical protein